MQMLLVAEVTSRNFCKAAEMVNEIDKRRQMNSAVRRWKQKAAVRYQPTDKYTLQVTHLQVSIPMRQMVKLWSQMARGWIWLMLLSAMVCPKVVQKGHRSVAAWQMKMWERQNDMQKEQEVLRVRFVLGLACKKMHRRTFDLALEVWGERLID